MIKNSRKKFKHHDGKKSFQGEIKIIFKGLSVAKNCLRPCIGPLRETEGGGVRVSIY